MKILGIETSCDETAAAVVENGTVVHSNIIFSQIPLHRKTGGVVPEVAAREHVIKIVPVVDEALHAAKITLKDIDAIAVTQGPGLLSSLVIGVTAASVLAAAESKKLIPVNHIAGHIYANWLDEHPDDRIQFPLVVLTVSGGHNELVYMKSHGNFDLLGETLDDAAGEAFDKVSRILGLGYPGGPQVARAAEAGNSNRFMLTRAHINKDSFDFSFSGLKTAVLNLVKNEHGREGVLSPEFIADCAASFQESVCDVLTDKLLRAAQKYGVKEVHLAGGVSANIRLREMAGQKISEGFFHDYLGKKVKIIKRPKLRFAKKISYCTDNAAMIAAAAYFISGKNPKKAHTPVILADPGLSMYGI
jgi:N6-L-threonylcarbamoyladenine synthase